MNQTNFIMSTGRPSNTRADKGRLLAAAGSATLLAFVLLAVSTTASAADRFDGLDQYVAKAMQTWEVPGLAIAVVKDGETVLIRHYGECAIGTDRKVTAQTAFPIASCAKSFTATVLALLVDDGKLGWDDPVVKHLPEFQLDDPYVTKHATLRDLLCHRTGLRRADLLQDGTGVAGVEFLRRLGRLEPAAEFRTRLIYNNHAYTVLDMVVERVAGCPYEQFVEQRLFQPLGMNATSKAVSQWPPERVARRHWRSDAGIVARDFSSTDGIYSTVGDMSQFLKLQLAGGKWAGRDAIKIDTVREMHALQFSEPIRFRPSNNIYASQFYGAGLGWVVQDYRGQKIVLHGGAWGAIVGMLPQRNLGVVVLANLDLEHVAALLMYDVFDAYLHEPNWDPGKWEATWLRHEPPGKAFRARDEARTQLEQTRNRNTRPTLPLTKYAGQYDSPLYGPLVVRQDKGDLVVVFGEHSTKLTHWQDDAFYARSPTRLTFDWLLTFQPALDGTASNVVVKHIGWDRTEPDHRFERRMQ